ncbi:MAG: carbamoyltransferase N-terminal domain-containing protein [Thermodesulfobacteriota bacterium]|nr:carbamoyltransferase N-terminal domain-containing protein [Thermodesulfobacteriota bacterium]
MVIRKRTGYVLGINCSYGTEGMGHDPSAALLKDGQIVALAAEERFNRIKKSPGRFPLMSIRFCLEFAGISLEDVDTIGWYSDPDWAIEIWKKGKHSSLRRVAHVIDDIMNQANLSISSSEVFTRKKMALKYLRNNFFRHFRLDDPPIQFINHHLTHLASAYYASGFDEALIVAWDSGGDLLSTMVGVGKGENITILKKIPFSQMSMGALYKIFRRYVNLSDEGSLMGLASYGRPEGILDFCVDVESLTIHWDKINRPIYYFGKELLDRLGPQRLLHEPISSGHVQVAADVQDILERLAFKILKEAKDETGMNNLCLAGGVALNATMNGKIARTGMFRKMHVHPNAGDGGCALGAAFIAYKRLGGKIINKRLPHVYWGRGFTNEECRKVIDAVGAAYKYYSDEQLPGVVADLLIEEKIIGWFRGRSEWGPR